MGRLVRLVCAACVLFPALAAADTVRVVPLRASGLSESQAAQVVRSAESLLRQSSSLVTRPAPPAAALARRCGQEDGGCWTALAARAGTDYALVVALEPAAGGVSAEVAMVDVRQGRLLAARRLAAPSPAAAGGDALLAAIDAVLPAHLRRGFGGLQVELPAGARLKVDGQVVLTGPSPLPVPVPLGRHEVDLLLPSGEAVLQRAEVAEGQTAVLQLRLQTPGAARRSNDALLATSAALWSAGTVSVVSSLLLAAVVNYRVGQVRPCAPGSVECSPQSQADEERRTAHQLTGVANAMMVGGTVVAGVGGALFVFDLVQAGGPR
jgi:hypothetical protein